MASWITHTMIVDQVLSKEIDLDARGFCVGNIAPDCNIENEDWTSYTPPKEITHFMNGKSKLTTDCNRFIDTYINGKIFTSNEEYSFILGYLSHLITDVEFQKFIRNEERVRNTFKRLNTNVEYKNKLLNLPETFDTIKTVFGKAEAFKDIEYFEHTYLSKNPKASYLTVLKNINGFDDYLDFLPKGAISRKIKIMLEDIKLQEERELYFFTKLEYDEFIKNTSNLIYEQLIRIITL
ncbi:MAG: zinc dependent phospholipase C family protein [Erysipelotrichales bacterium]|nr:zinc dependent phospholipase C family protein [Erysipelotrichales bacterium]